MIVECSSYPQVAEIVRRSEAAGILPITARTTFDRGQIKQIALPFLERLERALVLAGSSRSLSIRPKLAVAFRVLPGLLA